ncbi:MAG: 3-hydroxyisobutyryl-CoA hydrolase [Microbacterium sp. 67-17]|uniref:enoyl-CoA hydratase/isomerase family protein n=1 Tax=Microbacterium sp. 67-17 TaxID=1895782 RepID=UPI000960FFFA|nr:enoyl-CoA hydratase/isomerase family protein [Microbacterium sp. 67-17]OJW02445.1 MAG: 3-hydroxyisobutyryl-CoA hydrolase [Microbacterium sp. 67-17]
METTAPTVGIEQRGEIGILTLQRPRALNALDLKMIEALAAGLDQWEKDDSIRAVVLRGAGDRGFCAGGDVRGLYETLIGDRPEQVDAFFRAEYALNARIAEYRHPIVAFADGITMGGGIGLAGHASHRLVTERSMLAMPETRIGFTPDVGGSWLLGRAPGRVGEYLALTGNTVGPADAIEAGLADHHVPSGRLEALLSDLVSGADLDGAIQAVATEPAPGTATRQREWIDVAFAQPTVAEIVSALQGRLEDAARETAVHLESLPPTALAVTLEAVRRARKLPNLRAALAQEYGLVLWFGTTQPDLVEGIRAQLVDKDRSPRWNPAPGAELPADLLDQAFSFPPPTPLWS